MHAALRFGFGYALNAVYAAFEFKLFIRVLTVDVEHHFFKPAELGFVHIHHFGF